MSTQSSNLDIRETDTQFATCSLRWRPAAGRPVAESRPRRHPACHAPAALDGRLKVALPMPDFSEQGSALKTCQAPVFFRAVDGVGAATQVGGLDVPAFELPEKGLHHGVGRFRSMALLDDLRCSISRLAFVVPCNVARSTRDKTASKAAPRSLAASGENRSDQDRRCQQAHDDDKYPAPPGPVGGQRLRQAGVPHVVRSIPERLVESYQMIPARDVPRRSRERRCLCTRCVADEAALGIVVVHGKRAPRH